MRNVLIAIKNFSGDTMRIRMFIVLLLLSECVVAATKKCGQCAENVLDSDAYCPYCGNALIARPKPVTMQEKHYVPASPIYREGRDSMYSPLRSSRTDLAEDNRHWTPVKIGLCAPVSFPIEQSSRIYGLDLMVFGREDSLYGVGVNWVALYKDVSGILSGLHGQVEGAMYGGQINLRNDAKYMCGLQAGFVNISEVMHGVQIGFCNGVAGHGAKNVDSYGIQIGVINNSVRMKGVQIGLLNFIDKSSVPFFPIVNMCF